MDYKKFIDSIVGNIARKIEDEFNENDHPRDKGGKFTTKGGEGKGGKKEEPKKKKELLPETENEKAAKEELASSSKPSTKNVDKLIGAAMEGFMDDHELGLDFLKAMRVRTKDLYDEEGELDEESYADRIEKAIRNNPEKAADNLEQLGDILYEEDEPEEETPEGLDDYGEKLLEYASDIDTANDALRALNWDTHDYDDLEQAQTALKEAISQNPKAAKELWESTSNKEEIEEEQGDKSGHKKNIEHLKEIASDGFSEYPEMAQDFLKTMGVKLPKLSREEKEYYEEYPDEYQDLIMEKVHAAIERDPEAAKEALGEWADED